MPLLFTPLMRKHLTKRVHLMLQLSLRQFPELQGKTLTIGYSRTNLGSAVLSGHAESDVRLTIRLRVRKLTYNTIGHELMHIVQGFSQSPQRTKRRTAMNRFPGGEKQCDIWTLARSSLFCDDAPTYLELPCVIRENWPPYAESIRALCIAAIEKRKGYRLYIRWLESRIKQLAQKTLVDHL